MISGNKSTEFSRKGKHVVGIEQSPLDFGAEVASYKGKRLMESQQGPRRKSLHSRGGTVSSQINRLFHNGKLIKSTDERFGRST